MRIAVTTDGRNVYEQVDKNIKFTIFEVLAGQKGKKLLVNVSASGGQEALVYILKNEGVDVLLCGDISDKVKEALGKYNIEVISGLKGNVHSLIKAYIKGSLRK